jgi:flavin reductase (DIM6/NTAB) family NADH-FMN oxidoreductase RutF
LKVDPSLVHRLFYPQVPLVMAARSGRRVSAMPVVSYASVSDAPALVAVSCRPEGFTCGLARKARSFSLSILEKAHAGALERLATGSGAKVSDKLREAGLAYAVGGTLKVPVLDDAVATLECSLRYSRKFGDHVLLVAKVEDAWASEAFTDSWDFARYRPLLYSGWKGGLTIFSEG